MKANAFSFEDGFTPAATAKAITVNQLTVSPALSKKAATLDVFDESYLARLRCGDGETAKHFDRYFRRLLQMKLWGKFTRQIEEDLIDSVMTTAIENIMRGDLRDASRLPAYVSGICMNLTRQAMRPSLDKNRTDLDGVQIADGAKSAEQMLLDKEKAAVVKKVLRSLSRRDHDVLVDLFYNEIDRDEICRKYKVTRDNLRLVLMRARKRFQRQWVNG
jgi:RNA polymerase sigma factor (sigma-70 family)